MFNIILWFIVGILTLLLNDHKVYKINFVIAWIVLMVNLVERYCG